MEGSTGDKKCLQEEEEEEVGEGEVAKTTENSTQLEEANHEAQSLSVKSLDNLTPVRDIVVIEKSVQSSPIILHNKKTSTESGGCPDTTEGEEFASASDFVVRRKAGYEKLISESSVSSKQTDVLLDRLILEAVSSMSIWKRRQRRGVTAQKRHQLLRTFGCGNISQKVD
ncbi:unnamed protein product [Hydatigera taeniaeformis]|uniref:Uncharacterized protein n=1 Tax=Hydatigena taeniaeformis TaxID=6205 RepID=A0A0R3WPD9_HYDTA|nr:unnamed protein product [Hydatigera taeniaeformis]